MVSVREFRSKLHLIIEYSRSQFVFGSKEIRAYL